MLTNLKLFNDNDNRTQIINQFYTGLNQENIHDAVISLEERSIMIFHMVQYISRMIYLMLNKMN